MPVQTRSTTHPPSIVYSRRSSTPPKQKRSESEDITAAKVKREPETAEKLEPPELDIAEETEVKDVKKLNTEHADTNRYAFTPGQCSRPSSSSLNLFFRGDRARTYLLLLPAESRA